LAFCLVNRFPKLVTVKSVSHNMCGLEVLARKPCITLTWWQSCVSRCYNRWIHSSRISLYIYRRRGGSQKYLHVKSWYTRGVLDQMTRGLRDSNTTDEIKKFFRSNPDIMKVAIKHGSTLFLYYCLNNFDYLVWENFSGQRMLTTAIIERNEEIVHYICSICAHLGKDMTALVSLVDNDERNTILHYAAKLASPAHLSSIPGVALQIQRELQWLK
ncbi:hypothetical protein MKW94_008103, partial [Papaver nudicaule]|nr:hypothetical protein [Papaver nudicaule]